MTEENCLEKLKRLKAREREQLDSHGAIVPTIEDFWTQPHGVRLLLVQGNVVDRVPSVFQDSSLPVCDQQLGSLVAYPAHIGTLLSRRRKGSMSTVIAVWFSEGWTKIQETTGSSTSDDQVSQIAKALSATTVHIEYDCIEESIGLVVAQANGTISSHTFMTQVLTQPRGTLWHPDLVADPTPAGLTKALRSTGINIEAHIVQQQEMLTVRNIYQP